MARFTPAPRARARFATRRLPAAFHQARLTARLNAFYVRKAAGREEGFDMLALVEAETRRRLLEAILADPEDQALAEAALEAAHLQTARVVAELEADELPPLTGAALFDLLAEAYDQGRP